MSLKYFHIVFIALSVFTTMAFGLWAVLVNSLPPGFKAMGAVSIALGVLLLIYGIRFLKKSKSIII
jgi:VIT1/CCC1 family predicted Fe2+/Mn2+ transporter